MANAERSEKASIDEHIPMEDLLVLEGSLDGHRVRKLKDDGCKGNVVSHEFFERTVQNSIGRTATSKLVTQ